MRRRANHAAICEKAEKEGLRRARDAWPRSETLGLFERRRVDGVAAGGVADKVGRSTLHALIGSGMKLAAFSKVLLNRAKPHLVRSGAAQK